MSIPADLATLTSDLQYSDPPVTEFAENGTKQSKETKARLNEILNSKGEIKPALGAIMIVPPLGYSPQRSRGLDYSATDAVIPASG